MSTVETVSSDEIATARKLGARNFTEASRTISAVTQVRAALRLETSESTLSRDLKDLQEWCFRLAACGLQIVSSSSIVVDEKEIQALELMTLKYLQSKHQQW